MAHYTMTIYEITNNPLLTVFPEIYPFYTDDKEIKREFEETFILHYLTNEIGFETPYLFQQKLLGRLKLIMPYYEQLYQTEWQKVGKDMMNQKDLVDTVTHTLTSTSGVTSSAQQQMNDNQSGSQSTNQSGTTTSENNHQESMLADGVSSASLNGGYLTGVSKDTATGDNAYQSTGTSTNETSSNSNTTGQSETKVILEETTTNISHGDIGIQTPAYAIQEWRKVILNINKDIIEECRDLFMMIY